MKWKCSKNEFILILIIIAIVTLNGIREGFRKIDDKYETTTITDTVYNYITIDSIRYNIQVKDSIIKEIRYEYETKYIEADNLDDSASVELFKRLCSDDSLYGGENTN